MITLEAVRLHWIKDDGIDDPADLCAHSPINFRIDSAIVTEPNDGDWTVSASAIYLLRALQRNHTKHSPVGEHIFPCCGHAIYDMGTPEVMIIGCPNGIDFEIRHDADNCLITTEEGRLFSVPEIEWAREVFRFTDSILNFYKISNPKISTDFEQQKGFSAMMAEWKRLREDNKTAEQCHPLNAASRRE